MSHPCFYCMPCRQVCKALILFGLIWGPVFLYAASPLDFGAAGNASADDTAAVQSALDTGFARLTHGRYRITAPLSVTTGTALIGPGVVVVDFTSGSQPNQPAAINLLGDDATLSDFKVMGPRTLGATVGAIHGAGLHNIVIRGVEIEGFNSGKGIELIDAQMFDITNCHIHSILQQTAPSTPESVAAGITLQGATNGLISGNRIHHIEQGGEGLAGGYHSALIRLTSCQSIAIVGNQGWVAGRGIEIRDSIDCVISANRLRDLWDEGIVLGESSFCAVSGNQVKAANRALVIEGEPAMPQGGQAPRPVHANNQPITLSGVVGSVSGATEDPQSEGDTLTRLTDGNLATRTHIGQDALGEASFVLDAGEITTITDLTLITMNDYRESGAFPGGSVRLMVSDVLGGPYVQVATGLWECTRPLAGAMIDEEIGRSATLSEARRIATPTPVTGRYLRFTGTFCLDNAMLMTEALGNHGPVLHRLRPLGEAYRTTPQLPFLMTDGSRATFFEVLNTTGSVDLDLSHAPVEIQAIHLYGRTGALSQLPQVGEVLVSSIDDPDQFDSLVRPFNEVVADGKVSISLPAGVVKRYVRISWSAVQGQTDQRTTIAEIEADFLEPAPDTIAPTGPYTGTSSGHVLTGNMLLNPGAPGAFETPGAARGLPESGYALQFKGRSYLNTLGNQIIGDLQDPQTLVESLADDDQGAENLLVDNVVIQGSIGMNASEPLPEPHPDPLVDSGTGSDSWFLYQDSMDSMQRGATR